MSETPAPVVISKYDAWKLKLANLDLPDGMTLMDYQVNAGADVLAGIFNEREASQGSAAEPIALPQAERPRHVILAAPTGAGKTFIAAAVMQQIHEEDPEGTLLWVSYDPQLNKRSAQDFQDVFDFRCNHLDGENTVLKEGAGYLNVLDLTKMGKKKLIERPSDANNGITLREALCAASTSAIDQPGKRLYMLVDEGHVGARGVRGVKTNIERLYSWANAACVVAISATPERAAENLFKGKFHAVHVPRSAVIASGAIKGTIEIPRPHLTEGFSSIGADTRIAARQLADYQHDWNRLAQIEPKVRDLKPLMIVQLPNDEKDEESAHTSKGSQTTGGNTSAFPKDAQGWIDILAPIIQEEITARQKEFTANPLPTLFAHCISTIVGDYQTNASPSLRVPHIEPSDIRSQNNDTGLNVVFFKAGLETGWDCPTAEVLLSLAPRKDNTIVTQVAGRILRNPARPLVLAETAIPELDRAYMAVPFYDRKALDALILNAHTDGLPKFTTSMTAVPQIHDKSERFTQTVLHMLRGIPFDVVTEKGRRGERRHAQRIVELSHYGGKIKEKTDSILPRLFDELSKVIDDRIRRNNNLSDFIHGSKTVSLEISVGDLSEQKEPQVEHLKVGFTEDDLERLRQRADNGLLGDLTVPFVKHRAKLLVGSCEVFELSTAHKRATRELAALMSKEGYELAIPIIRSVYDKLLKRCEPLLAEHGETIATLPFEQVRRKLGPLSERSDDLAELAERFPETPVKLRLEVQHTENKTFSGNNRNISIDELKMVMDRHLYSPIQTPAPAPTNEGDENDSDIERSEVIAIPTLDERELEFVRNRLSNGALAWYRNPERHEGNHPGALAMKYNLNGLDRLFFPDFVFIWDKSTDGQPDDPVLEIIELHGVQSDTNAKKQALESWNTRSNSSLPYPPNDRRIDTKLLSSYSVLAGRDLDLFADRHILPQLIESSIKLAAEQGKTYRQMTADATPKIIQLVDGADSKRKKLTPKEKAHVKSTFISYGGKA